MKKIIIWIILIFSINGLAACSSLGIERIPLQTLEEKNAATPSEFITINNTRLHYRDQGSGPVIILMHGVMSSLYTWEPWVAQLKQSYRVITFDVPPFGLSDPLPNQDYDTKRYMDFIHEFAKTKGLDSFIIGGNSYGGYLAWNYAAAYPEQVKTVVLIDAAGYHINSLGAMRLYTLPVVSNIASVAMPKAIFANTYSSAYGDPKRVNQAMLDRDYEFALKPGARTNIRAFFADIESRINNPQEASKKVKNLKMPVILMWGKKDQLISYQNIDHYWKKDLPNATVLLYDDLGHVPMDEDPQRTVTDLMKVLQSHPN